MTNLEKFQEVFGITIDDGFLRPSGHQCAMLEFIDPFTSSKCEQFASCHYCPLFKFWNKKYIERPKVDQKYTYGTKFVKEALSNIE